MQRWPGWLVLVLASWVGGAAIRAQEPPQVPAAPTFQVFDFGVVPRPSYLQVLLNLPAVQAELQITAGKANEAASAAHQQFIKLNSLGRRAADRSKLAGQIDASLAETRAILARFLGPQGYDRLRAIQLQAQGPIAFAQSVPGAIVADGPGLAGRLQLTADQLRRIAPIAEQGDEAITRAAVFPIGLDTTAGPPSPETIRKYVESPEFGAARRQATQAARKVWNNVIGQIERELTEDQRTRYHDLLGAPFDLAKIELAGNLTDSDAELVAAAFNPSRGGQRADPDFDTRIARPAFRGTGPRVLFDEAHHNFHTADGRYKPFAELITHDGYLVTPNREPLTRESLARADILITANAMAEEVQQPGGSTSAFTDAEADAVRDWVRGGGSLLLITDHEPFGSGSENLAQRFGVAMSKQVAADPVNSEGNPTSLVFTRGQGLIGDHPITLGRDPSEAVNKVRTFTGQSLLGPAGSIPLLKLAASAVESDDDGKESSAAGRSQGLALAAGKGRLVVLGEAAELSAQLAGAERLGMNVPGLDNRQFALNIMHWLAGVLEPRGSTSRQIR